VCDSCDYAANEEKAESRSTDNSAAAPVSDLRKVATPGQKTVEEVAAFLGVGLDRLIKTLIYVADGKPVAVLLRGDREVNDVKLRNRLAAVELELASPDVIQKATGAAVGFAGPVGLSGLRIIADREVPGISSGVTGGNETDMHYVGVAWGRDFATDEVVDIRNAEAGEGCPRCDGGHLQAYSNIEVGNTFMLGTKYSQALGAQIMDEAGVERPCVMGSYGIGITRSAQAAVEAGHDDDGIVWPWPLAPYQVLLLPLNMQSDGVVAAAEELYVELSQEGFEVLLDDRDERGGVKFKDADLVGIPIQVVIGERGLATGEVEVKIRKSGVRHKVARKEVPAVCQRIAQELAPG
jgi:prolyl-tRNA synthetase